MLKAVLFDLGGTLLHYQDGDQSNFRHITYLGLCAVHQELAARLPVPPLETFIEQITGNISQTFMVALQELRGGSVEVPIRQTITKMGLLVDDALWAVLRERFYAPIDAIISPREGAQETLTTLKEQGYLLGLLSNTFWAADLHGRHLAEYGLLDLLPVRLYSSGMPHIKPHPAVFYQALADIGAEAEEAAYVGDRLDVDVMGAQRAGMRAILIRSPYREEYSETITPDAVIDELLELPTVLENW